MYSLSAYGRMIGQPKRFDVYRRAIEAAVKPGDRVADLGAGPGVFALIAAQAGAAQVFAVEPDPVVGLAAELAAANGLGDRITVVEKMSTQWFPEEPIDVIVSDLRGVLPTFTHHLPSIADAQRRLLRPGGKLIPAMDEIWAAPVSAQQVYDHHLGGFADLEDSSGQASLDLQAARQRTSHEWCRVELPAQACVATPRLVRRLDYAGLDDAGLDGNGDVAADLERDADASLEFTVVREAPVHGLAVWFDSLLAPGLQMSNAPADEQLIYGQAFFPLPKPIRARSGDGLSVRFQARHDADDYIYRWQGRWHRQGVELERFDQSTFYGAPLSRRHARRFHQDFQPPMTDELRESAASDAYILRRLSMGSVSLGDIAVALAAEFPRRFADSHAALRQVSAVVHRYLRS